MANAAPPPPSDPSSPRWLSHHGPDDLDRCCRVGRRAVCRRCLALYPLAVVVAAVAALWPPGPVVAAVAVWILPAPFVVDWVLEHLGRVRYSPARQVGVTLLAAPALGVVLGLHARDPFTATAVLPAVVWGGACLAAAWVGGRDAPAEEPGWEERHLRDEAERDQRLRRLLTETDQRSDAASGSS